MQPTHQPREEFVDGLEQKLVSEVRRRRQRTASSPWLLRSRMRLTVAAVALVIISMAAGGAAVVAAYEAQASTQRELLTSTYQQRVALAQERAGLANKELKLAEQRFSTGLESQDSVLEAQFKIREATSQLELMKLQLEEVTLTAREPQSEISAPLVSGRDFVSARLQLELAIPRAALELDGKRLQTAQRRVAVGAGQNIEIDEILTRLKELEVAVITIQRKLQIRQQFLAKQLNAEAANLRLLEAEADQRRMALAPRLELATKRLQSAQVRVEVGTMNSLELANLKLELTKLQLDLAQAEADLARIRQRIKK